MVPSAKLRIWPESERIRVSADPSGLVQDPSAYTWSRTLSTSGLDEGVQWAVTVRVFEVDPSKKERSDAGKGAIESKMTSLVSIRSLTFPAASFRKILKRVGPWLGGA